MPERLSLNFDFEKIKNSRYFTFFFFIKLFGFDKDAELTEDGFVKLLIFHEEKDDKGEIREQFFLAWTPSSKDNEKEKLFFFL